MISRDYKGYMEGVDITKVPLDFLAYPSKNCFTYKGVAYSRPGIQNDGTDPTGDNKITGEFVWKDALGGEKALRTTKDGRLQLKYEGLWVTIFSSIDSGHLRVRFATWIDSTGNIIKKRLFFVDGTANIYEWNGAVGVITSVNAGAQTMTVVGGAGVNTLEAQGFDPANVVNKGVRVIRFSAGVVAGSDSYTTDDSMADLTLHVTSAISNVPVAGDIIVGAVVTNASVLSGVLKDDVYDYNNHLAVASLTSITVYFSDVETKLEYTVPAVDDRVATSPFFINLAGNYTAMIRRYNQSTQETILWVSDIDGWTKVNALLDQDNFGNWVRTQRVAETERIGAVPFCVADYKGDPIYFASDKTIQRIVTLDVLGKDTLQLISDEVDGLLDRLDNTESRIYYLSRYIFLTFPAESIVVMLDMIEGHFQPPQTLPMGYMSVIEGIQHGHSNSRDESFLLFTGRNDLGARIQTIFAFGYTQGFKQSGSGVSSMDFRYKSHSMIGVSGRMTSTTQATVEEFFETDGAKAKESYVMNGAEMLMYAVAEDYSWATHPWASFSWGGEDAGEALKRFYAFRTYQDVSWLEFAPRITVNGDEQEFHLLGWYIDESESDRKIGPELFIPR